MPKQSDSPANPSKGWLSQANEETLQRLVTVIDFAEGFTLLFAQCNVPTEQERLLAELRQRLATRNIVVSEVRFDKPIQNIREQIQKQAPHIVAQPAFRPAAQPNPPTSEALQVAEPTPTYHATKRDALLILGMEHSIAYKAAASRLLAELNLGRDAFRYQFPCALLFWLPDYALTAVARQAPDFWAWRSGVFEFESQPELRDESLRQLTHGEGSTVLAVSNAEVQAKRERRQHLINLLDEYERLPVTSATQSERANLLVDIGWIDNFLGEKRRSLVYFEEALHFLRILGDRRGEASILNNIGGVYSLLGEKLRALNYYEDALALQRALKDRRGEALLLNNMGVTYSDMGDKLRALKYYEEALTIRQALRDRIGESETLNNIGNFYYELGEKLRALKYYEDVLALCHDLRDRSGEAKALGSIGNIYADLGEQLSALKHYQKALLIEQSIGDHNNESITLSNIGNIYSALGEKRLAIDVYKEALLLLRTVGDVWGECMTRFNLALCYEKLGELEKAEAELNWIVTTEEAIHHPDVASDRAVLERIQRKRQAATTFVSTSDASA